MKDIKITTIRPTPESRPTGKTGAKESTPGLSFDKTLHDTIARVSDLKVQTGVKSETHTPKTENIQDEISTAREMYDQMMQAQQKLSKLYQRITDDKEH